MTAAMIGAGILFFPPAPMFLFMRGKDVVIAKGTPVTAYVDRNTELEVAKFEAPAKPIVPAAPPPTSPESPRESVQPATPEATSTAPPL